MSEVAAVIFFVIRSEWLAYACFSAVVQRMHYDNFLDGLPCATCHPVRTSVGDLIR